MRSLPATMNTNHSHTSGVKETDSSKDYVKWADISVLKNTGVLFEDLLDMQDIVNVQPFRKCLNCLNFFNKTRVISGYINILTMGIFYLAVRLLLSKPVQYKVVRHIS